MQTRDLDLGFFAHPDAGLHPGVVLIHDVWGLADHTRDLARRLAGEGFGVLAIDLYRREAPVQISDPGRWMRQLSDPRVLEDIGEGVRFLQAEPTTSGRKVGVVGFCMGGMYAVFSGCGVPGVSAIVPFYGLLSHDHGLLASDEGLDPERKPRPPLEAARDLQCPVLGFFGADDDFVPVSDVDALREVMEATGQPTELLVYPGAGHAFMNDTREDAYRPEAAADAWQRMVSFLQSRL
jgi:carboxymethylenebutenolidase